jgi:hypothetical protein
MLYKLLKSTELRELTSFVSPAFFDVLPSRKIWTRGRSLITTRGSDSYRDAVQRRALELPQVPLSVRIVGNELPAAPDSLGAGENENATRLVTLYFHQLFSSTPTLLDLRSSSCGGEGAALTWKPAAWVCSWDESFLANLRTLYAGFYDGDDALFRHSLKSLRIDTSEDLFRRHFGGEQQGQAFKMRDFIDTFHEVFLRCRDAKVELHPDFLALAVYLATLYEHLDGRDVRIDVRACYQRARGQTQRHVRSAPGQTELPRG